MNKQKYKLLQKRLNRVFVWIGAIAWFPITIIVLAWRNWK